LQVISKDRHPWVVMDHPLTRVFDPACFMLAGGLGLILIGLVTEEAGRLHFVVAATYFLATPVAYLLFLDCNVAAENSGLTLAAGTAAFLLIALVPHRGLARDSRQWHCT
jgi:hypothetical membrane protein